MGNGAVSPDLKKSQESIGSNIEKPKQMLQDLEIVYKSSGKPGLSELAKMSRSQMPMRYEDQAKSTNAYPRGIKTNVN